VGIEVAELTYSACILHLGIGFHKARMTLGGKLIVFRQNKKYHARAAHYYRQREFHRATVPGLAALMVV